MSAIFNLSADWVESSLEARNLKLRSDPLMRLTSDTQAAITKARILEDEYRSAAEEAQGWDPQLWNYNEKLLVEYNLLGLVRGYEIDFEDGRAITTAHDNCENCNAAVRRAKDAQVAYNAFKVQNGIPMTSKERMDEFFRRTREAQRASQCVTGFVDCYWREKAAESMVLSKVSALLLPHLERQVRLAGSKRTRAGK
jgi:hypothetical protein